MAVATTSQGRVIHYDEWAGDGDPVILVSGLGGFRASWRPIAEQLAPEFRVIALDNRDAGENGEETADYSVSDMASDVAALMDTLGIERAAIVGHSMGGFISLHLATEHADRVAKLVLVGTSPAAGVAIGQPFPPPPRESWIVDPVERSKAASPASYAPGFFDRNPGKLAEVAEMARGNRITRDGYARQARAINETHDVRPRLGEITAPTLVIHGDTDPSVSVKGGKLLLDGIPNATMHVYPGVGHHPMREEPERFIDDLLTFLRSDS
ncbi:MAG: alpha/beta hydrolase [Thermomicrobiales bacterium]|nr:alpha/beta hydrolase [Thermomicrobiales bacterium]